MKKTIIIILAVIFGAILLRYGMSVYKNIKTGQAMRNKPAPQVVVETINERSIIRTYV